MVVNVLKQESNIITYKRDASVMAETNQGQGNPQSLGMAETNQGQSNPQSFNGRVRIDAGKILTYFGIAGGIITIIGAITSAINKVIVPITQHTDAISQIRSSIDDLDDDIQILSSDVRTLTEFMYTSNGYSGKGSKDDSEVNAKKLQFIDGNFPQMDVANNEVNTKEKAWNEWKKLVNVDVAEDPGGNKYTPPDLVNVTFVTSYRENGKEVYFLGQYNEKGHWNGKCILNAYSKGKLESILQAIYNDGELYSYQRVSAERDGTWNVADIVKSGNHKEGEIWVYDKIEDYNQDIGLDNYDQSQILDYDNFTEYEEGQLLSYYNGEISNGYYNDDDGDAYLISYFRRGEIKGAGDKAVIRTLYQGNFLDGDLEDESDSAWYITREVDTTYMYYEGPFRNGTSVNKEDTENYLEYDRIVEILEEKGFEEYSDDFFIDY